jgi:hypothetical protein
MVKIEPIYHLLEEGSAELILRACLKKLNGREKQEMKIFP